MKKIKLLPVLCVLASALFTGCKSNMFIKRHYNNGYYIAKNERLPRPDLNSGSVNQERRPQRSAYPTRPQSVRDGSEEGLAGIPSFKPNSVVTETRSQVSKPALPAKQHAGSLNKSKAYSLIIPHLKNTIIKPRPLPDAVSDGLSLFWIVILAILILWAIAFIAGGFGLGDLIHILLVIALVLLILWLVKVL